VGSTPKKKQVERVKKKYKPKVPKKEGVIKKVSSQKKKKSSDSNYPFSMVVYVELPVKPEEKHLFPNGKFQRQEESFRTPYEMWNWFQRKKGKPKQKKKVEGQVKENSASFGTEEQLEKQEPNVT
jgi:hypothetical protein